MGISKIKFVYKFLIIPCFWINSAQPTYAISKAGRTISNYRPTLLPVQDQQGQLQIVIRLFDQDKELYALLVDPYSLTVSQSSFSVLTLRKAGTTGNLPGYFTWQELEATPYVRLIRHCERPPYPLQNDGVKRALGVPEGYFLTVDMCPSSKPFDKEFFERLITLKQNQAPFPIGIGITGLWMLSHPNEFGWLCKQHSQGKLSITWINHTFRSQYYHDLPLENNFLRFSMVELPEAERIRFTQATLQDEVLLTEQLLLERGQLPSVFFRFPGLVSDEYLMRMISNLGLIPLGTDAWLAKNEQPQLGSIILVHANGNEPSGLAKFIKWLDGTSKKNNKWLSLMHLAQGLISS
jgi:hypothetical protein